MSTAVEKSNLAAAESALISGNLSSLTPEQRLAYYHSVCDSLGLNPLTRPFEYITLNNKLTLYARKDATDQLRKKHVVSITKLQREVVDGVYVVTATATDNSGRTDESIGAVPIEGLKGDARANAMMKAESKSKRRVTLSICGLGMLDETEIETIHDATPAPPALEHKPDGKALAASKIAMSAQLRDGFLRQFDDAASEQFVFQIAENVKVSNGSVLPTDKTILRDAMKAALARVREAAAKTKAEELSEGIPGYSDSQLDDPAEVFPSETARS